MLNSQFSVNFQLSAVCLPECSAEFHPWLTSMAEVTGTGGLATFQIQAA